MLSSLVFRKFQFLLCVPGAEFLSGTSLILPFFTSSLWFCLCVCVCLSGVPGPEHRGHPHRLLLRALRHHAGPDGSAAGHLGAQLLHSARPHLHGKLREERPAGGRLERRRAGRPVCVRWCRREPSARDSKVRQMGTKVLQAEVLNNKFENFLKTFTRGGRTNRKSKRRSCSGCFLRIKDCSS